MWDYHDRLPELINEVTCRDVIQSFVKDGQRHPVLARPMAGSDGVQYELIYGARRLFAARHLNVKLLAHVRNIDNISGLIEMDVENRLRCDISPYERGMSFKGWLRKGYFRSQEELARALSMSTTHVCRLMRFADLPTAIVSAFPDPREIKESWAVTLAERCADEDAKQRIMIVARSLRKREAGTSDSKRIYKSLLDYNHKPAVSRVSRRDEIVRSSAGVPLFRVSYRHNDLHVIIRRDAAPPQVIERLTSAITEALSPARPNGFGADGKLEGGIRWPSVERTLRLE